MAEEGGHGEECSALRRLIILLLARNIMLDRQVFTRKIVACWSSGYRLGIDPSQNGLAYLLGVIKFALGIYVWVRQQPMSH